MIYAFYVLHVVICLFLILVVLLQQGKGADLSVFGGGSTMTAFGARGAATLLHKLTVWGFVGFIVTTMAIGVLQGQNEGRTVMGDVEAEQPADAATPPGDDAEATEAPAALPEADAVEGDAATEATEAEGGIVEETAAGSPAAGDTSPEVTAEDAGNTSGDDAQP